MLQTSARLLRLLSLLQVRPDWTGPELARRLGVTTRTVRADVDRLRDLGYPVDSRPGVTGGYRLGESATMPPMLLEDDEAVALAVGLRAATSAGLNGMDEAAVRALVKLQRLLPHRLRARVEAIGSAAIAPVRSNAAGHEASPDALAVIASACRDHEWLRFDYPARTAGSDEAPRMADSDHPARSDRLVEPYRLLLLGQRWYLFAWDLHREDWRTFRVDRMQLRSRTARRFAPRELPTDDEITARLRRGIGESTWKFRARVVVHASEAYVRSRMPIPVDITALGDERCSFRPGSDDAESLALYLGMLRVDFAVVDAPELSAALRRLAERYTRAAGGA